MQLSHLLYVSRRQPTLTPDNLRQIATQSAVSNARQGITGVLLCRGWHLMQLLEGDQPQIKQLFDRISTDPRHSSVQQLLFKPVRGRLFPDWGMGLANLDSDANLDRDRLLRMLTELRSAIDTATWNTESRMLLQDFESQLTKAA